MNGSSMFVLQGQLFLLLAVGIIIRKIGLFDDTAKRLLTDLVLFVTLPSGIIRSFVVETSGDLFASLFHALLVGIAIAVISFTLSRIFFRKSEAGKSEVLRYALLVSNAGFLGLPIAWEVFGSSGYMYAAILMTPLRIMMWSAGVATFKNRQSGKGMQLRQVLLHPCMIAVYIGLFLMVTGLHLPPVIDGTLASLGGTTTTLSMLLIGSLFGEMKKEDLSFDRNIFYHTAIRLLLIPALTYAFGRAIGADRVVYGVGVLLSGMPAGSTTVLMATKYDGDAAYASKLVLFSTTISMITIPLWLAFM
jgi:predicted permease